jgi:hypothetical protein
MKNPASAGFFVGACRDVFGVHEIERRPRGASRINPLLHLLQRAYV